MAIEGGGFGVVQDSLVRNKDVEHTTHDISSFSGAQGEGDKEGEDKAQDIGGIIDFTNIDGGFKR
jgi:uncharacterized protein YgfB (UPF0149 family)